MSSSPLLFLSTGLALILPAAAHAQAGGEWTGVVVAATDNRSKDQSKSDGGAFVGATAEWTSASGLFYAGPGVETIDDNGAEAELNAVAGVRPQFHGFDLNFSATYKWRVTSDPGVDDTEFELTSDASRSLGPASARLRFQYAPDAGGGTDSFTWIEARLGWDLTTAMQATAAVGQRDRQGGTDYTGWNVGVAYDVSEQVQLDLRYHDTNLEHAGAEFDDVLVASVFFDF